MVNITQAERVSSNQSMVAVRQRGTGRGTLLTEITRGHSRDYRRCSTDSMSAQRPVTISRTQTVPRADSGDAWTMTGSHTPQARLFDSLKKKLILHHRSQRLRPAVQVLEAKMKARSLPPRQEEGGAGNAVVAERSEGIEVARTDSLS